LLLEAAGVVSLKSGEVTVLPLTLTEDPLLLEDIPHDMVLVDCVKFK
jgi:hypothetical protein